MRYTSVKVAMLAGLLAGCNTACENPAMSGGSVVKTASIVSATATVPCPKCLTQLVFIQKEFKPIADGPAGNWKTNFEEKRVLCVKASKTAHPDYQAFLFDYLQESIDVSLLQGQPKLVTLVSEMKGCMLAKGYGLVEVQGRSSG